MSKIKLCKKCRSKNNEDLFYSGYYNWLNEDCYECPMKDCDGQLIDINLSKNDFDIITSISKDIDFLEAMIKLHDEDIIEYELKMSQFKSQLKEQKSNGTESNNKTKCPKCGHTEFTPVRKKWSIMTGFMTNKVELICNNCGAKMQK